MKHLNVLPNDQLIFGIDKLATISKANSVTTLFRGLFSKDTFAQYLTIIPFEARNTEKQEISEVTTGEVSGEATSVSEDTMTSLPTPEITKFEKKLFTSKTVLLGFPLICLGPNTSYEQVVAPLFFSNIELEIDNEGNLILMPNKNDISMNPDLEGYFLKTRGLAFSSFFSITKEGRVDIIATVNAISNALFLQTNGNPQEPVDCPESFEPQNIYWTGILDFSINEQGRASDASEEDAISESLQVFESEETQYFVPPVLPLRSEQFAVSHNIIKSTTPGYVLYLTGPSKSGKTYTAIATALQAITQGLKVNFVTNNHNVINQLEQILIDLNLDKHAIILKDELWGKPRLINALSQTIENVKGTSKIDTAAFEKDKKVFTRIFNKLNTAHTSLHKSTLNKNGWPYWVGKYLDIISVQGPHILEGKLNVEDFEFTESEFELLKDQLYENFIKFRPVGIVEHPLKGLNNPLFIQENSALLEKYLTDSFTMFQIGITKLYNQFSEFLQIYVDNQKALYLAQSRSFKASIQQIEQLIAENKEDYGAEFDESSVLKQKIFSPFSEKYKHLLHVRKDIVKHWNELIRLNKAHQYFETKKNLPTFTENFDFKKLTAELETFKDLVLKWEAKINGIAIGESATISTSGHFLDKHFKDKIADLNTAFATLLGKINNSGIFEKPFQSNDILLIKMRDYLSELHEKISIYIKGMNEFPVFYAWRRNTLGLSPKAKNILNVLMKNKPLSWLDAFESWYIKNMLNKYFNDQTLPMQNFNTNVYFNKIQEKIDQNPKELPLIMLNKQAAAYNKLKKNSPQIHKTLFSAKSNIELVELSLRQIISASGTAIQELFPLLCCTSTTYNDIIQDGVKCDLLIIDDVHNIDNNWLVNSKKTLMISDHHNVPYTKKVTLTSNPAYFNFAGVNNLLITAIAKKIAHELQLPEKTVVTHQNIPTGITLDIVVMPHKNNPNKYAIFIDSFLQNPLPLSWLDMKKNQKDAESLGYHIIDTWSVNWWENPQSALKEIIKQIDLVKTQNTLQVSD
jgi:hypothetical protein